MSHVTDLAPPHLPAGLARALASAASGAVSFDVPLSRISRWRIGGRALAVVEPGSTAELSHVRRVLAEQDVHNNLIGDTSNLLFDSRGYDGVLIRVGRRMSRFDVDGTAVWSQGGTSVPLLSRSVGSRGLSGIEHTVGIPGTLGGLVVMNGGSQRKGIGLNVERVVAVDVAGHVHELDHDQCAFAYRSSSLQASTWAVAEVNLRLEQSDPTLARESMRKVMLDRFGKFPSNQPNCGSTFLSDPGMYATVGPPGRALEEAGLKGLRRGGAVVSTQHANFIVNTGDASSDDVLWLIATMRARVAASTGYAMDCEARFLAHDGRLVAAHQAADERYPGKATRARTG